MVNKRYYIEAKCYWCEQTFSHRYDVHKRQLNNYGHFTCRKCFGKEPSFRNKRKEVMLSNNPFKNKKHSNETKNLLSKQKLGKSSWNKGLTIDHPSVLKNTIKTQETKSKMDFSKENNPNWKGGKSRASEASKILIKGWWPFRQSIIKRDCNKCWKCGEVFESKYLDVHHLLSRSRFPDYRHEETNCIVLCSECHKEFHTRFKLREFESHDTIMWINETRKENERLILC